MGGWQWLLRALRSGRLGCPKQLRLAPLPQLLPATSRPETGECVKAGKLEELADQCLHSAECATFAYRLGELWGWAVGGWVGG